MINYWNCYKYNEFIFYVFINFHEIHTTFTYLLFIKWKRLDKMYKFTGAKNALLVQNMNKSITVSRIEKGKRKFVNTLEVYCLIGSDTTFESTTAGRRATHIVILHCILLTQVNYHKIYVSTIFTMYCHCQYRHYRKTFRK